MIKKMILNPENALQKSTPKTLFFKHLTQRERRSWLDFEIIFWVNIFCKVDDNEGSKAFAGMRDSTSSGAAGSWAPDKVKNMMKVCFKILVSI